MLLTKIYRVKKDEIIGNLNIENRFVKKGEIIIALKDNKNITADFEGKIGKRYKTHIIFIIF